MYVYIGHGGTATPALIAGEKGLIDCSMCGRLAFLRISKHTQAKLTPELYRNIQINTRRAKHLTRLSRTLSSRPRLGCHVKQLEIIQSSIGLPYSGYMSVKAVFVPWNEASIQEICAILSIIRPEVLVLRFFQTVPRILNAVQTSNVKHLGLSVRFDVAELPHEPHLQSDFSFPAWVDVIHRARDTLTHLQLGGRLITEDAHLDDLEEIPHCPRLVSFAGVDADENLYERCAWPEENLFSSIIIQNFRTLQRLDLVPLTGLVQDLLIRLQLPDLRSIKIALKSSSNQQDIQMELSTINESCPVLEEISFAWLYMDVKNEAFTAVALTLEGGIFPNLKRLDMYDFWTPARGYPEDESRRVEACCLKRGIQFYGKDPMPH